MKSSPQGPPREEVTVTMAWLDPSSGDGGDIPAVFDWRGAWTLPHRGRTALVLWAPTTTSWQATRPLTRDQLSRYGGQLGLVVPSRSGRQKAPPLELSGAFTSSGVVVQGPLGRLARIGRQRVHLAAPLPAVGTRIDLFVTAADPNRYRNLGDLLRDASHPWASGTLRLTCTPPAVEQSRYVFVGVGGDQATAAPHPSTVLVDLSVLIDAERLLTAAERPRDLEAVLRDQLAWLTSGDTVPGIGLGELLSGGAATREAEHSLSSAWRAWLAVEAGHTPLEDVRAQYRAFIDEPEPAQAGPPLDGPLSRSSAALIYLVILEAVRPWVRLQGRPFVQRDRVQAYLDWVDGITQDHAGFTGHGGAAIQRLLLGRGRISDDAAALLKLARKPPFKASALRGAAHDLFYLSVQDLAAAGAMPHPSPGGTVFMTADKPLARARRDVGLLATMALGRGSVGIVSVSAPYESEYSPKNLAILHGVLEKLRSTAVDRSRLGDREEPRHRRIVALEAELTAAGLLV